MGLSDAAFDGCPHRPWRYGLDHGPGQVAGQLVGRRIYQWCDQCVPDSVRADAERKSVPAADTATQDPLDDAVLIPKDPAARARLAQFAGLTDEERAAIDRWCFLQEQQRQRGVVFYKGEPADVPAADTATQPRMMQSIWPKKAGDDTVALEDVPAADTATQDDDLIDRIDAWCDDWDTSNPYEARELLYELWGRYKAARVGADVPAADTATEDQPDIFVEVDELPPDVERWFDDPVSDGHPDEWFHPSGDVPAADTATQDDDA